MGRAFERVLGWHEAQRKSHATSGAGAGARLSVPPRLPPRHALPGASPPARQQ